MFHWSVEDFKEFLNHLLHIKDKRMLLLNKSAEHITEVLQKHHIGKADYIVSSIPLASIPAKTENQILVSAHEALKEKGKYIHMEP